MISILQLKAARVMLNWSAKDLAQVSGVGVATIRRYEMQDGIPSGNAQNLFKLKTVLEAQGIEFVGEPLINPGVFLNIKKKPK